MPKYIKQVFIDDETELSAQHLQNMEAGIAANGEAIDAIKNIAKVEFDSDTRYLHFLDQNGTDLYEPILIEGGGGGNPAVTTSVKLVNTLSKSSGLLNIY